MTTTEVTDDSWGYLNGRFDKLGQKERQYPVIYDPQVTSYRWEEKGCCPQAPLWRNRKTGRRQQAGRAILNQGDSWAPSVEAAVKRLITVALNSDWWGQNGRHPANQTHPLVLKVVLTCCYWYCCCCWLLLVIVVVVVVGGDSNSRSCGGDVSASQEFVLIVVVNRNLDSG